MFAGSLDIAGVTDLLGLVGRARKTGVLQLRGPSVGVVRFLDGDVTFASARADRDLGSVLVRAGFVTAEGWAEAVSAGDPKRSLATVLHRHQVDPERLYAYVRQHTEEAIWELDQWPGEFAFECIDDNDALAGAFRYLVPSVLAGVQRRDRAWADLARRVPSLDLPVHQAPLQPGDDSDLTLSRPQYRVLTAADGRPVRAIAAGLDLGLFATCELVAGLLDADLLVLGDGRAPAVADLAGPTFDPSLAVAAPPEVAPAPVPEPTLAFAGVGADAAGGWTNGHNGGDAPGARDLVLAAPVAMSGAVPLPSRVAATPSGLPAVDFVSPRQQPARDLILRLLSAVKEL